MWPVLDLECLRTLQENLAFYRIVTPEWVCVIHPSVERDLRVIEAKERWAFAWREWRKAGKPEMGAAAILERFGQSSAFGETGTIFGAKIITPAAIQ